MKVYRTRSGLENSSLNILLSCALFFEVNMDSKYINLAISEAKKAVKKEEIPVGAVIVKDGKVIAKAYNKKEGKNFY